MSAAARIAAVAVVAASFTACSLGFGENFSGGATPNDGSDASSTTDASTDASPDSGGGNVGGDAGADAGSNDVTRGLLLHYRFDEASGDAVVDSAPKLNHAKFVNGAAGPPTRVPGVRSGALAFASSSRVDAPYHPNLLITSPFTVAMWVNAPAGMAAQGRLLAYGDAFDIKLNVREMQLSLLGQYGAVAYDLPPDRWTHYAVVFESGSVQWYVDGTATDDSVVTFDGTLSPQMSADYPIRLANSAALTSPYAGMLDDVRVYSVALTPDEVGVLAKK